MTNDTDLRYWCQLTFQFNFESTPTFSLHDFGPRNLPRKRQKLQMFSNSCNILLRGHLHRTSTKIGHFQTPLAYPVVSKTLIPPVQGLVKSNSNKSR